MHKRRCRRGDAIFGAGETSDIIYLVRSGTMRREDDGHEAQLEGQTYRPGTLLGHLGPLTGGTRAFTARAFDDIAMLAVAGQEVLEHLEADADTLRILLESMSVPP